MKLLTLIVALWAAPLAAQTPLAVQTASVWNPSGSQSTYTLALKKPVAAGDVLLLPVSGNVQSISDSLGNSWTQQTQVVQTGLWSTTSVAGPSDTVTVTLAFPGAFVGICAEYSGITGILSAPVASGQGSTATSQAIAAQAGDILVGYGVNWTSSTLTGSAGSGFAMEASGPNLFLEDMPLQAVVEVNGQPATANSTATYPNAVTWYQGVLILHTVAPPPPITLNLTTKVVFCTKCDRTDDTPAQGALVFEQNGSTSSFQFASDGSVAVNVTFDMTKDPVVFSVVYQNANGQQATGSGWQWSIPRASFSAGVATLGTLSFGGVAFTLNSDGSISFAGFLPAQ